MKIISISDKPKLCAGKKVILRLDLNVPLAGRRISNDYKLRLALPTITFLLRLKCSLIIITHLGEPPARITKKDYYKYSVRPIAVWLEKHLGQPVSLLGTAWSEISKQSSKLRSGEIALFENIRLFPGEIKNDISLARRLASLGEIYINDAFAVCHRNHASVSAITGYLPSYAGPQLMKEIANLEKARTGKSPFVLIMGGAKIATKIPLLKKLGPKASSVLVGGAIANSLVQSSLTLPKMNIIYPLDFALFKGQPLDIGPKTIQLFSRYIAKARTIVWNGPLGMFEKKGFDKGTKKIATAVSKATSSRTFTLIGGGETVEALGSKTKFSWISTGGGASLAYLSGLAMPGLIALMRKK